MSTVTKPGRGIRWLDKKGKSLKSYEDIEKKLGDPSYRILAQTLLNNGYWVSTVWIGLVPLGFVGKRPPIFQTKVFYAGTVTEVGEYRYSSQRAALSGHHMALIKWINQPKAKKPRHAKTYPGALGYKKRASPKRKKGKTHANRKA